MNDSKPDNITWKQSFWMQLLVRHGARRSYCWFRRSLKTLLSGQSDHCPLRTLLTAPFRNILTYLITYLLMCDFGACVAECGIRVQYHWSSDCRDWHVECVPCRHVPPSTCQWRDVRSVHPDQLHWWDDHLRRGCHRRWVQLRVLALRDSAAPALPERVWTHQRTWSTRHRTCRQRRSVTPPLFRGQARSQNAVLVGTDFKCGRGQEGLLIVRRQEAHTLWPLTRRGLDRIDLAYSKPVCQQSS